ncbi:MAG: MATE family efflux transporter [Pseudobutyrivibrio ruminis]|nr:MATE family efflux transporter [Pseudobutyrivibrio ruminis]
MSDRVDLTKGNVFKTLLRFSFPFVISTFLQTAYNTIDMIIVGNVVGKEGLSALSVGTQLMELIALLCVGFSTAGQILVSQYVGANDKNNLKRVIGTLFDLMIFLALLMSIVGIIGCDSFLQWLNTPSEAFIHAHHYVTVCCFGILFTGLYNMVSAVFRGMGDSKHPMIFIAIASICNIILDLIFVAFLDWGATGAALATIIGQVISVIFSINLLIKKQDIFLITINKTMFTFDMKIAITIIKLGIPIALQTSAIYISFLFVNKMMNAQGVVVSAAFGTFNKIRNFPNIFTQAVGLGCTAMMGQNIGAGNMDRVDKTYKSGVMLCIISNLIFAIPYLLAPKGMFRLFTSDESVIAFSTFCILCIVCEMPAKFFMPGGNAIVSASGFVKFSMAMAIMDAFVGRIFFTWLLGSFLNLGTNGYFIGYVSGTYITSIALTIYYLTGKWRTRKRLID